MDKQENKLAIAGKFYTQHIRNGEVIDESMTDNLFINEGLIYALNAAFGAATAAGGAPTPITTFYIGLATANRTWTALDSADTIGGAAGTALEFQSYTASASAVNRPEWAPQILAARPSTMTLTDSGYEATFDVTGTGTIYGAFLIDSILKDGTGDTTANYLIAGSNFTTARALEINDVFKVGYVLTAASGV